MKKSTIQLSLLLNVCLIALLAFTAFSPNSEKDIFDFRPEGPGEFISSKEAHNELLEFFEFREKLRDENNVAWDEATSAYYNSWGLTQIKEFIEKVDQHNTENRDSEDDLIGGVRIYKVISEIDGDKRHSIMMMPYLYQTGKDLYPVGVHVQNENLSNSEALILNRGPRCPPDCPPHSEF